MAIIDPGLQRLVDEALALGFRCVREGDYAPFCILYAGGEKHLTDLKDVDGTISEALLGAGRELIRQFAATGQCYVLVWDGYLNTDGKRQDAILAEAGAADGKSGFMFVQLYKQSKSGKMSKLGKPFAAAEVTHLWAKDRNGSKRPSRIESAVKRAVNKSSGGTASTRKKESAKGKRQSRLKA